ncbi:LysR family transcriptional regulator YnfL [Labilithrix luteola]|uniref:LysR family transcriptional regulator YnfL n=1 Tax=Labilithrix luteola TaxID=1391654 RepID=A0A0K1Q7U6_9BACT|nr:LysR substrate-binding domain-containing protein [Labilithrix luteola]AKV01891.1 LysR family transcriptional regulator YnfL [Labilithrix luteola]
MELRHLRYFVAVAEELHFGRAAKRLRISQPPLSAQIRDLEDEVGARLFERGTRNVDLTAAGRAFFGRAKDLLARAEAAKSEANDIGRGELGAISIGYTTTAMYELLPRVLTAFRAERTRIGITLAEMPSRALAGALDEGRIDVGFACLPTELGHHVARVVDEDRMVIALPERHPLARRAKLRLRDLETLEMVGVRPTIEPGWAKACEVALANAGVFPKILQEADTKLALLGLVAAGLGAAVVSSSLATLARTGVVFRPIQGDKTRLALGMLSRKTNGPLVKQFMRVVESVRA